MHGGYLDIIPVFGDFACFQEQLVLSVAESVFPWLTNVSACAPVDATVLHAVGTSRPCFITSYISRRRKLNPLANCDDDIPAFHCQRLYKIRYFGVEFVIDNKVPI
ncbi:hypothetical protein T09_10316 [Trichinella sp. T9]|nr:hypothetical protein T09_10316 [Trichinella sp. T9]